ncbi:MAG: hypothetical protein NTW87_26735 [Planctomycetota bacterium]|nr:hypothetical protein [Planctomycetota bacterium]
MIAARQVLAEINQNRKVRLVADGPASRTTAPYEYSPEVLAKIRERLHTE